MSEDSSRLLACEVPGPLGDMVRALPLVQETQHHRVIHSRVLVVDAVDGTQMVVACLRPPTDLPALHEQTRDAIESALLAERCAPIDSSEALPPDYRLLRFASYIDVPGMERALRAFGLKEVRKTGGGWPKAEAHLRGEWQSLGLELPDVPRSRWEAEFTSVSPALRETLSQARKAGRWSGAPWGSRPGELWKRISSVLGLPQRRPSLDVLREFEQEYISTTSGKIRSLPAELFQASCDLVGLITELQFNRRTCWAEAAEMDNGLNPPPHLQIERGSAKMELPIGLVVLRWWIMPLAAGEKPACLAEWLEETLKSL
ncbi:MAG: hypothetical protein AAF355_14315 [Myxococcota bacterium]